MIELGKILSNSLNDVHGSHLVLVSARCLDISHRLSYLSLAYSIVTICSYHESSLNTFEVHGLLPNTVTSKHFFNVFMFVV